MGRRGGVVAWTGWELYRKGGEDLTQEEEDKEVVTREDLMGEKTL